MEHCILCNRSNTVSKGNSHLTSTLCSVALGVTDVASSTVHSNDNKRCEYEGNSLYSVQYFLKDVTQLQR